MPKLSTSNLYRAMLMRVRLMGKLLYPFGVTALICIKSTRAPRSLKALRASGAFARRP